MSEGVERIEACLQFLVEPKGVMDILARGVDILARERVDPGTFVVV